MTAPSSVDIEADARWHAAKAAGLPGKTPLGQVCPRAVHSAFLLAPRRLAPLAALCALFAATGCLPPPIDDLDIIGFDSAADGKVAADGDAATADAGAKDGAEVEDGVEAADGAAEDVDGVDAAAEVSATQDIAVALPKGCTADSDCAPLEVKACLVATCAIATGKCSVAPASNGATCENGNPCQVDATCKAGECTGNAKDCDDANSCTNDACLVAKGCVQVANHNKCDDGDKCTVGDYCHQGSCQGAPKKCVGDECANAQCNAATGECNKTPKSKGAPCDDGDSCTVDDVCVGIACEGDPKNCDDGDPCTEDYCPLNIGAGCLWVKIAGPTTGCQDGDPCKVAGCVEGKCVKGVKPCVDKDPCTADTCKAGTCAYQKQLSGPCEDGDPCTIDDLCLQGQCKQGTARDCTDSNPCTDDSCQFLVGCAWQPNFAKCNDGSACTAEDTCTAGACKGKLTAAAKACDDANSCTDDACTPATGKCQSTPLADGATCPSGACKAGSCQGGGP